jgi:hypothetical protein
LQHWHGRQARLGLRSTLKITTVSMAKMFNVDRNRAVDIPLLSGILKD